MEKKIKWKLLDWGFGIMEKKVETTRMAFRDTGKEHRTYCSILGLYWENADNGSYYSILG